MKFNTYQAETAAHAARQALILQEAKQRLQQNHSLSALEFSGVAHALQVITESAIGKAKHLLKAQGQVAPVSAYDCFALLHQLRLQTSEELQAWQRAVGLRNRIVHDYLNLDSRVIYRLLETNAYQFMLDFLNTPFQCNPDEGRGIKG